MAGAGAIHALVRQIHLSAILRLFVPVCSGLRRPRAKARSLLKAPIKQFESFNSIEQLEACLKHLVRPRPELLSVPNREFNPIDSCARLVRHFEFEG